MKEGDVVIIGNKLPSQSTFGDNEWSANTGQMGLVTDVEPKLTINRKHAVELDLVFTDSVEKKTISSCVKYLDMPEDEDTLEKLLQHGKCCEYVFPVTFIIRKLLMAATIIAYPEFSDEKTIGKARDYLRSRPKLTNLKNIRTAPISDAYPSLVNYDLHIHAVDEAGEVKAIKAKDVVKFTYMGAIAILVRGGFVNLLEAFLSAKPPIGRYYDELMSYLGDTGHPKALDVLRNYK